MNYQRILRITNYYLFFIGYQIRFYDPKKKAYTCSLWALIGFVITTLLYGICFAHHFEVSGILKIFHDVSPFLEHLIRLQVLLGLKAFIFCIIQWREINSVSNDLLDILPENVLSIENTKCKRSEIIFYLSLFSTLFVAFCIGLYIAIEMKFELPPLDHIMIAVALFIPHLMISGALRIYLACLWLIRLEFMEINIDYKIGLTASETNEKIVQRLHSISKKFQSISSIIQKQLLVYFGLNFNALLYSAYSVLYFEKFWYVIFTGRYKRIFYAANSLVFICIFLDYALLMAFKFAFDTQLQAFRNKVLDKLFEQSSGNKKSLREIAYIVNEKFNVKLFNLMDFNIWNFFTFHFFNALVIVIVVLYQYFNDQIAGIVDRLDN